MTVVTNKMILDIMEAIESKGFKVKRINRIYQVWKGEQIILVARNYHELKAFLTGIEAGMELISVGKILRKLDEIQTTLNKLVREGEK